MGGSGDPVTDLQQAVSSHYGFEPSFAPQTDISGSIPISAPAPDAHLGF